MKWGIIGAMPSEAELLKGQMEDLCEIKIGRLTFWEGLLCGQDAVIAVCGIGKVNAAITAQMMIDRFEVEAIINTGHRRGGPSRPEGAGRGGFPRAVLSRL